MEIVTEDINLGDKSLIIILRVCVPVAVSISNGYLIEDRIKLKLVKAKYSVQNISLARFLALVKFREGKHSSLVNLTDSINRVSIQISSISIINPAW